MSRSFAVTWDYRCPFARNAHEHLVAAMQAGADWEVSFVPFSLGQAHVEEGQPPVWEDPSKAPGLLAMEAALVVRDQHPESFLPLHLALFRARHDEGRDLREEAVVREVLAGHGLDASAVLAEVSAGWPREAFRKEHESSVDGHAVFGVPTFILGDRAVFVRLMTRPAGDAGLATRTIERVLDLVSGAPELNEFKHTTIER